MKRYLRMAGVVILVTALFGALQFGWSGGAAGAIQSGAKFDNLSPAPFTAIAPGPITIGAHANGDAALNDVTLSLGGDQIAEIGSQTETSLNISQQRVLTAGTYTATVVSVDANGHQFQAQWDFVVASNTGDSEWFTANGSPKADQINATMQSLVQAFRWHLYGLSWDGSNHPDLPTHVGLKGTGDPVGPWVTGTTFDQADTTATLRSLVEAFRWHFWGISWDGANHPDVPTHASTVQGPQSIDPWFDANGNPIPANITATLRSLVESFRWHFWGYSWDGSQHPDMPTHASMGPGPNPTPSPSPSPQPYPTEGMTLAQSSLKDLPNTTSPTGATGSPTSSGYKLTVPPEVFDGLVNPDWHYGDASYSLTMRALSSSGESAGCLTFRTSSTSSSEKTYLDCLFFSDSGSLLGNQTIYLAVSAGSSAPVLDEVSKYVIQPGIKSTDWNTVKVIVKGNTFWFFVNGTYLGTAIHSGSAVGDVGFAMFNFDESDTQSIEFTDLQVHALQTTNGATGQGSTGPVTSTNMQWISPALRDGLKNVLP